MTSSKQKRDRGRLLTDKGWNKIWAAINDTFPSGYTLTAISEQTDPQINPDAGRLVSDDTVSNIVNRRAKADKPYIESLFKAFGLTLEPDDLTSDPPTLPVKSEDRNFVGREGAIAHLNSQIQQGSKITVIQSGGGFGKTTLAQQYLRSQGFDLVLELLMAKERESITAVDAVVEEWLKQDFKEEPGREFGISLKRLKEQLQARKVGILIDNLEPALDQNGRFIEKHRGYVELLRVLADPSVQSVTLITSRERLCDADVSVDHYLLPGLDKEAWQEFFSRNINIDDSTLKAMHKAYGGNAKAMGILCGAIREDFDGDMAAYWRENSTDPLVETDLKNLVTSQFNRLQYLDPEAYKLLCRLGCFRYQDVPTVPTQGLCCLLWDVPKNKHKRIIKSLRNRSLVECDKEECWLHPMIRQEAIARLRASEDWERTNCKTADFWTKRVKTVETIEDGLKALEAYYHYQEIDQFDSCYSILINTRDNSFVENSPLVVSFYRLGFFSKLILLIEEVINKIDSVYNQIILLNLLGDLYYFIGSINQSLYCYDKALKMSDNSVSSQDYNIELLKSVCLVNIACCKIRLLDIENILDILLRISKSQLCDNPKDYYYSHIPICWFLLAFIYSLDGNNKEEIKSLCSRLENTELINSEWANGNRWIYLSRIYKNLGHINEAFMFCNKAIEYAKISGYIQLQGNALTGLAELYRIQQDFETSLSHHSTSIELLDKIGAKCDLAEAYYQFGLTYQKMSEAEKSQTNFDEAIRLFTEIEAPKQVERVRQSMQSGI